MITAIFHFHGDLNDFLRLEQRGRDLIVSLPEKVAVKHPIEALGVPHPEVESLVVNGAGAGFDHAVSDGDCVELFPLHLPAAVTQPVALRPPLLPPIRFVIDTHLGVLATYLRLLGFDALYRNDFADLELATIAADEGRVLLTRDRGLLKRKIVTYGHCLRETAPRRQVVAVLKRFALAGQAQPWQRCLRCNGLLETVEKTEVFDRLQPKTQRYYEQFQRCTACDRIYWQGSHHAHLAELVAAVLQEAGAGAGSVAG